MLLTLTIALLLYCSKSWCQNNVGSSSFTGEIQLISDSTCIVPIKLIKQANVKLIERNSFSKIITEQNDIINLQKQEIKECSVIIKDMQNRIVISNNINNELNDRIDKYRKRNKILIGTTCGAVLITALVLIAN